MNTINYTLLLLATASIGFFAVLKWKCRTYGTLWIMRNGLLLLHNFYLNSVLGKRDGISTDSTGNDQSIKLREPDGSVGTRSMIPRGMSIPRRIGANRIARKCRGRWRG